MQKKIFYVESKDIVGKKLLEIECKNDGGGDEFIFKFEGATSPYRMYHQQDCCESVGVDSGHDQVAKLVGKRIVEYKEEIDPDGKTENKYESSTVTRYTFVAEDGTEAALTWIGYSNGYYSETVEFEREEYE